MKKKIFLIALLIALCCSIIFLWNQSTCKKNTSRSPGNTNVLLITIDTLRSDHIGAYGYNKNITPHIDKLAKEGITFKKVIAQAPYTAPSHASILTSTYPFVHNTRNMFFQDASGKKIEGVNYPLPPENVTLAEILKEEGYYTSAFVSGCTLTEKFSGLHQGFDVYEDTFDGVERGADSTNQLVFKWLQENYKKKFFLWVHYFDPHFPYSPPESVKKDSTFKKMNFDIDLKKIRKNPFLRDRIKSQEDIARQIYLYDMEIKFVDEQVGTLLKMIKEYNIIDNTLIILTADHGESLIEHNEYFDHGSYLYDVCLKIPLIIKFPHNELIGKVRNLMVQSIDIMPTILDFLKIQLRNELQGKSLMPIILNKKMSTIPFSYSESDAVLSERFGERLRAYREENWKLIYASDGVMAESELYNKADDPYETKNVIDENKELAERLKEKLLLLLKNHPEKKFEGAHMPDEETKEKLKSLGYL
jgi:arylsulfatase A-like enzyme